MKQIPDQLQRQIWATEQEILDVIHQVCTEYGLRYSLAYGTLIGAVRHKGFIPWDDDIDLIMPREDYEKLLAIWNEAAPKGYILQNTRTDPDFTQNQRIIAGNAQFTGIAAGQGVGFTTGLLLLREGLGMRETPIRPHS